MKTVRIIEKQKTKIRCSHPGCNQPMREISYSSVRLGRAWQTIRHATCLNAHVNVRLRGPKSRSFGTVLPRLHKEREE